MLILVAPGVWRRRRAVAREEYPPDWHEANALGDALRAALVKAFALCLFCLRPRKPGSSRCEACGVAATRPGRALLH
jgi:hypothetical protein